MCSLFCNAGLELIGEVCAKLMKTRCCLIPGRWSCLHGLKGLRGAAFTRMDPGDALQWESDVSGLELPDTLFGDISIGGYDGACTSWDLQHLGLFDFPMSVDDMQALQSCLFSNAASAGSLTPCDATVQGVSHTMFTGVVVPETRMCTSGHMTAIKHIVVACLASPDVFPFLTPC